MIAPPTRRDDGVLVHHVESEYQRGETEIQVLLPEPFDEDSRYPAIYLLPVSRHGGSPWGDGMLEVLKHEFHKQHPVVFVMPTFSHAPWYADNPADRSIRQESHLTKVVVPFIDQQYPVSDAAGRLLLGFSKSGWGAFSLLLRQPEMFSKAAAWDAPLGQQSPTKYGMSEVFPSQYALEPYIVWELLAQHAESLAGTPRFALLGYGDFRGHHQATHYRMMQLGIPHEYQDGPRRKHDWHSGWVQSAIEFLVRKDD